jgi:hypothetical protein
LVHPEAEAIYGTDAENQQTQSAFHRLKPHEKTNPIPVDLA